MLTRSLTHVHTICHIHTHIHTHEFSQLHNTVYIINCDKPPQNSDSDLTWTYICTCHDVDKLWQAPTELSHLLHTVPLHTQMFGQYPHPCRHDAYVHYVCACMHPTCLRSSASIPKCLAKILIRATLMLVSSFSSAIHMYVCMYVRMYVCIYIYIYIYIIYASFTCLCNGFLL